MTVENTEWMTLDNAALIYPVARNRNWTALFRVSCELKEDIDPDYLQLALERTIRRFPSFAQRLRHGVFWYYLERIDTIPRIQPDVANPCVRMDFKQDSGYMFRVRYYGRRIALEVFHVLSDGTGGMCFLKTLVAEYLKYRYGAMIPRSGDIKDCNCPSTTEEIEDSFLRFARNESLNRRESPSYRIKGAHTPHFMNIITGLVPVPDVKAVAAEYGGTVGEFLSAVLILSIDKLQRSRAHGRLKPVKVNVPVNLRQFYPSCTVRNFASYVNPGIEPRLGEYTLRETVKAVRSYIGYEVTEKRMNARFSTNVKSAKNGALRAAPRFLKTWVLKTVYLFVGDRYSSSTLSNLGKVELPPEMAQYVERLDFMLGPLHSNPVTCACIAYNGKICINFTRTIRETDVEREFFTTLVKLGIPVLIESNGGID